MGKLEKFRKAKKSELILMISILRSLRFMNSVVGEFLLSFAIIVGVPLLLCGVSSFVFVVGLIVHFSYMLALSKLVRTPKDKKELHDELTEKLDTLSLFIKEKNTENK